MKMMNKFCALMLSVALCAGMAAPAFAYGGEPVEEAVQTMLQKYMSRHGVMPSLPMRHKSLPCQHC